MCTQERRHRSIQSKNAEAARHELYEKAKGMAIHGHHSLWIWCNSAVNIAPLLGGLDVSGNLRHSPLPPSGASKLTAFQRALHGKEVSFL